MISTVRYGPFCVPSVGCVLRSSDAPGRDGSVGVRKTSERGLSRKSHVAMIGIGTKQMGSASLDQLNSPKKNRNASWGGGYDCG